MNKLTLVAVLLILTATLHFGADLFGIYQEQIESGFVWFDNVLHFVTGITTGIFWFWVLEKYRPQASPKYRVVSTILVVLGVALGWELFEFLFLKLFAPYAMSLQMYSTSVGEATADALSNLLGAVVLITSINLWRRKNGVGDIKGNS